MTKQEALIYLNATEETWEEDLENNLFELKKDLFRRVLIPKLLFKKAEKVKTWNQASIVLGALDNENLVLPKDKLPNVKNGEINSILDLYRTYESSLMKLKLILSRTIKANEIVVILTEIANLELQRQASLKPLALSLLSIDCSSFEVKLSEDNQTGIIISELKLFKKETITEKKDLFLLPYFEKDLQRILKSN